MAKLSNWAGVAQPPRYAHRIVAPEEFHGKPQEGIGDQIGGEDLPIEPFAAVEPHQPRV